MPYFVGTDEAGYAPNLGPLVVSATVWHSEEATTGFDFYKRLKGVVSRTLTSSGPKRLAIADSKVLYNPAAGLGALEEGVLAALWLADRCPDDWLEAWQMLDPSAIAHLPNVPWHRDYNRRLPLAAEAERLVELMPKLRRGFERAGIRLVSMKSRAVFPELFNRSTHELGNKGELLSKVTLGLLADALGECRDEAVHVVCDKHGGRNRYGRLLQEQFPEPLVEVHAESLGESLYRWGPEDRRIEVRFRAGGETFMPAALASMASKYLRELAMRAFNDFWCGRIQDLAPTAGYPRDARRFYDAIRAEQAALGIADHVIWRAC